MNNINIAIGKRLMMHGLALNTYVIYSAVLNRHVQLYIGLCRAVRSHHKNVRIDTAYIIRGPEDALIEGWAD